MVSAFNPAISFCTGSHNNVGVLGSLDQAKNAMFYLMPHQGKNKFPVSEAFSIIHHSLKHVDTHESASPKDDKDTTHQKIKQLLARVLNQMSLRLELSDCQVAAALLDMSSMIVSDTFEHGNPMALAHLKCCPDLTDKKSEFLKSFQKEMSHVRLTEHHSGRKTHQAPPPQSSDNASSVDSNSGTSLCNNQSVSASLHHCESLRANPGMIRTLKIEEDLGNGNVREETLLIPQSSLYLNCGDSLSSLNYYECLAIIAFKNTPHNPSTASVGNGCGQCLLHPAFEASAFCHHAIKAKQSTPILSGKISRHPGNLPENPNNNQLQLWQSRADKCALYYLLLFRPETVSSNFTHTWHDLQAFIADLQNDTSFLSKCRLMTMKNHMNNFNISKDI